MPRLIEARDALEERISYNESAMTLIIAMGGQYDSTEDKVKLNLLDLMIQMISVRSEGFKEVMNAKAVSEKNRGLLKSMFGV